MCIYNLYLRIKKRKKKGRGETLIYLWFLVSPSYSLYSINVRIKPYLSQVVSNGTHIYCYYHYGFRV